MFKDIEKFDRQSVPDALRVLNLGELGDPLAVDDVTGLSEQLVPFMPAHAPHTKLLFLTKSDCVRNLLAMPQVWKAVGLEGKGLCCNCTG